LAKRWEKHFFENANAIVSLTREGVKAFAHLGYSIPQSTLVEVIPTCADLTQFFPGPKDHRLLKQLRLQGDFVIGSVGNLSGWYLRSQTLSYLSILLKRVEGSCLLFVTQEDPMDLRDDALRAGISQDRMRLLAAEFHEMPSFLRLMDLGVFFIRPCFSKIGSCATKLAEFLATGVPVVINEGIGDSAFPIQEHRVGLVLRDLDVREFEESIFSLVQLMADQGLRERCRLAAEQFFDLRTGVRKYLDLYERLEKGPSIPQEAWKSHEVEVVS